MGRTAFLGDWTSSGRTILVDAGPGETSIRKAGAFRWHAGIGGSSLAQGLDEAAGGSGCLAACIGSVGCVTAVVSRASAGVDGISQALHERAGKSRSGRGA